MKYRKKPVVIDAVQWFPPGGGVEVEVAAHALESIELGGKIKKRQGVTA